MFFFFFFQAEDGIRDGRVTGVQTCALPIFHREPVFAGSEGFGWDGSRRACELLKDGFEMQKGFGLRRISSDYTIDILNELLKSVSFTLHGLQPSRRAIIDYCCDLRPTNTSNNERVRLRLAGYP